MANRKAWPAVDGLAAVETAALAGCAADTRLDVVTGPTGPAWLPIAVFFTARGHKVFRVLAQKAADLRRFLSRHAKGNGIDADTLARLALVSPAGLQPLILPGADQTALDRRVRATDRLTRQAADHKRRIKDLARSCCRSARLAGDLGAADVAPANDGDLHAGCLISCIRGLAAGHSGRPQTRQGLAGPACSAACPRAPAACAGHAPRCAGWRRASRRG